MTSGSSTTIRTRYWSVDGSCVPTMKPGEAISHFARRNAWAKSVLLRFIPNTVRTVQLPGIGPMRIRNRDHRSYWLRDPLEHDRLFLGGIANLVKPGMVVWDVGAHIGLYARIFSQVMHAGHVFAFEPDPSNRQLLAENLRIGGVDAKTTVLSCALCDTEGTVAFIRDTEATQQGRIATTPDRAVSPDTLRVECRTVDGLVQSGTATKPDVIKIDVEGAEALLLRGARRTLEEHSPLLAVELHAFDVRLPVFDELSAAGYTIQGYRDRKWRRLVRDDFENPTTLYDPRHIYAARDPTALADPAYVIEM